MSNSIKDIIDKAWSSILDVSDKDSPAIMIAKCKTIQEYILYHSQQIEAHKNIIGEFIELKISHLTNCKHIYPNGKGAMESGLWSNSCTICGWDDLFSQE